VKIDLFKLKMIYLYLETDIFMKGLENPKTFGEIYGYFPSVEKYQNLLLNPDRIPNYIRKGIKSRSERT